MKKTVVVLGLCLALVVLAQYPGMGPSSVVLRDKTGDHPLASLPGAFSAVAAPFTAMVYCDYPELAAAVRTHDRRPELLVSMQDQPLGRVYLVKAKPDKGDRVRSVKLGKIKVFKAQGMAKPDSDWVIECEEDRGSAGTWILTPKKDLEPGEYGLWISGLMYLYDFGVDP